MCLCLLLLARCAAGQQSLADALAARGSRAVAASAGGPESPAASLEAALRAISDAAGVIFAGEVSEIKPHDGVVEIVFRVQEGVRGVDTGAVYRLQEWAGLWTDHARFHVGQRLLMLLHAPSAAGFASPVGGMDGAIPLVGEDAAASVDLRWVATHVAKQKRQAAAMVLAPILPEERAVPDAAETADIARTDRGVVMDLLHAWQRNAGASR